MHRNVVLSVLLISMVGCKTDGPPRACQKMKEMCDSELDTCISLRETTKKELGDSALDKLDGCLLQANTCSEAAGCVAASATKSAVEAAKGFIKGFADEMNRNPPAKP